MLLSKKIVVILSKKSSLYPTYLTGINLICTLIFRMRGDRVGCLPHHSQYQGLPHLHHMLLMCPTWRKRRPVLRVKEHLLQLSWTGMYDVFQLEMLEVIRFPSLLLLSIVAKCFFTIHIYICSFVDYYMSSGRFLQHNARRCENASVAGCPSLQGRMTSSMSK